MRHTSARFGAMFIVLALLTACNFGYVRPETFNQYALLATHSASASLDLIDSLEQAGKFTKPEALEKVKEVDAAKAGIDTARKLFETDPTRARNDLDNIILTLNVLRTTLEAREGT